MTMTKKTEAADAITAYLSQCNGFETHYKHWTGRATYSEGVRYVAEAAGAYWLIDAVLSHQTPGVRAACRGFQVWRLTRNKKGSGAKLTCTDGGVGGAVECLVVSQRIAFTDFPLEQITLYLENGVLMLREER